MSSHIVFTSRHPKIVAIGTLLFIGVILFCTVLFSLSPVEAKVEDESRTALTQPEPPLTPSAQVASTVFLPLVAHESISHVATHEEAPPALVLASSDHTGHSTTPPPTANSHTFVADEGGYLDGYWERSQLPNGLLTFSIAISEPTVSIYDIFPDGLLTPAGLDHMVAKHKLFSYSLLTLHVWDVDHDARGCAEADLVSINGYLVKRDCHALHVPQ
jgi:hypothetical protein